MSDGSSPGNRLSSVNEAARFHCSVYKAVIVFDAPGLIEIVLTLELCSAINPKLVVVWSTAIMSTCNGDLLEKYRKVETRAISSSSLLRCIWVQRIGESSTVLCQRLETIINSRGPARCPSIASCIHQLQSSKGSTCRGSGIKGDH
jgi:hypothetical protein